MQKAKFLSKHVSRNKENNTLLHLRKPPLKQKPFQSMYRFRFRDGTEKSVLRPVSTEIFEMYLM